MVRPSNSHAEGSRDTRGSPREARQYLIDSYQGRADLLIGLNRGDEARPDLDQALELAITPSQHASRHYALGAIYYRLGKPDQAIDILEPMMAENSHGGSALELFYLSIAHWKQGDKFAAHKWYDKAVDWMDRSMPHDPRLARLRAESEELLGLHDNLSERK